VNIILAIILALVGGFLIVRDVIAVATGVLNYHPRYQPDRTVRFHESPREFIIMIAIFGAIGIGTLIAAWSLINLH
jgi:hypothetical protein